jgi:RHS repeat-associated protein
VVERFTYDNHYGKIITHTKSVETDNPYAYTGRVFDTPELYYYRARYYDPTIERFISEDPIGFASGDFNWYRYVGNDPVDLVDPWGLLWGDEAGEYALKYYMNKEVETGNKLWYIPAFFAALWTPDTSEKTVGALSMCIGGEGWFWYKAGKEISFGRNFRFAPFGNRTGHPLGRYPHYHRRGIDGEGNTLPGQGIGRHRPWETKTTDKSFWDRF